MPPKRRRPTARPTPRATTRPSGASPRHPHRPSPAGRRRTTPPPPRATGLRGVVERRSAVLLVYLSSRPRWLLPIASGLLLLVGVVVPPPIGLVALALVALEVLWLAYLSWPVVGGRARVMRLVVVAMLLFLLVQQARL